MLTNVVARRLVSHAGDDSAISAFFCDKPRAAAECDRQYAASCPFGHGCRRSSNAVLGASACGCSNASCAVHHLQMLEPITISPVQASTVLYYWCDMPPLPVSTAKREVDVTVVLNVFNRPRNFAEQMRALLSQSVVPRHIWVCPFSSAHISYYKILGMIT